MSEADKMFKELGYIKDIDVSYMVRYNKDDRCFIRFMIENKEIVSNKIDEDSSLWILNIGIDLLKAIYLKCEELKWI